MPEEKLCPMLQKACLREGCALWIKVTISGTDREGKSVTNTPPEQCAFVWVGLAGLKAMQFPGAGRPAPRPGVRPGPARPAPRA